VPAVNSAPDGPVANVRGPFIGYVQLSRTGGPHTVVRRHLDSAAARLGGHLQRVAYEAASPAGVLWSVVEQLDRERNTQVTRELAAGAVRDGIDLRSLLAATPNPALWALVAELGRTGGVIVTPSPEHLDSLGKAKGAVLQWLSQSQPAISVLIAAPEPQPYPGPVRGGSAWRMLCELRSQAFGYAVEQATITAHMHLSRAGLVELVSVTNQILTEIIGEAITFVLETVPEQPNQLLVRLLYNHRLLRVEVIETRDHAEEPVSDQLTALCAWPYRGRAYRARTTDGRTLTGCEVPLPLAGEWR